MSTIQLTPILHTGKDGSATGKDGSATGQLVPSEPSSPITEQAQDNVVQEYELPPVDGGIRAWTFLFAAFILEGLVLGLPQSYGLFQDNLTKHTNFGSAGISIVGTLTQGLLYMAGPFSFPFVRQYPRYRQISLWAGLVLTVGGYLLSSFATKLWHFLLAQAIVVSVGSAFLYAPAIVLLNEWFVQRRGLATGIMYSGTGLAGLTLPFFFGWMLDKYGFRTTYRAWAVIMLVVLAPVIPAVQGRIPIRAANTQPPTRHRLSQNKPIIIRLFKSPMFWFFSIANILQAMSHFIPPLYLPTYVNDVGETSAISSIILVSVAQGSTVLGRVGSGHLSDITDLSIPTALSPIVAALSVVIGWGLSTKLPGLTVFAAIFGIFSGGWSVLWSRFCTSTVNSKIIPENDNDSQESRGLWYRAEEMDVIAVMYGTLSFGRGIGSVLTGPMTSALLSAHKSVKLSDYGIDKYQDMILVAGITMFGAAIIGLLGRYSSSLHSFASQVMRHARISLSRYAR